MAEANPTITCAVCRRDLHAVDFSPSALRRNKAVCRCHKAEHHLKPLPPETVTAFGGPLFADERVDLSGLQPIDLREAITRKFSCPICDRHVSTTKPHQRFCGKTCKDKSRYFGSSGVGR